MKKIKITIPTVLSLALLSFTANAAPPTDSLMYLHESWAGAYFGASFGSGAGDTDVSLNDRILSTQTSISPLISSSSTSTEAGLGNLSGSTSGSLADLFVGYNFHPGWWGSSLIIGGQLEGTFFSDITLYAKGIRKAFITTITNNTNTTTARRTETLEYTDNLTSMFTFLGRLGFLATPNFLIYVLGGGAEGHFVLPSDESFDFNDDRNQWQLGYTVGGGLEYRFNNNWSMRGEYRYMHFDIDRNPNSTSTRITNAPTSTVSLNTTSNESYDGDFNFNMGKIAIVYRFDTPSPSFK